MGLLISKTDFIGKYKIAQNNFSDVDSYIDKYEEFYLIKLLGVELFKLFKADVNPLTKQPVTLIYLNLYNKIQMDFSDCIYLSEGLKQMVLGFIYFEYNRDVKFKNTVSGQVVGRAEISRESGFSEFDIYTRYNLSVNSYKSTQWYICKNEIDYPLFNGQTIGYNYWI